MAENISLQDVKDAAAKVRHPAINSTLVELGIVNDIRLDGTHAKITLALPALNIPPAITKYFIDNLTGALGAIGVSLAVDQRVMDEEERQRFFSMEQANWKGL